jgi:CHASE2 domain-containing sensor protein
MFEFFAGGSPALGLLVVGVVVLGAAMVYGVMRTGWLKPRERAALDENTRARQRSEDPQKASGAMR